MNEINTDNALKSNERPLMIRCKSCGAPVTFDIIKQNHCCLTCGGCGATVMISDGNIQIAKAQGTVHIKNCAIAIIIYLM